jgi:hypothetical protein
MRPSGCSILCFACILLVSLTACQSPPPPPDDEADRAAAEAKLQQMLATKQRHADFAEKQRQIEAERAQKRIEEANRPRYSPARLAKAAKPRTWGYITVPDLNIKCVFNSTWTNGNLNYRVALLGERPIIDSYLDSHPRHVVRLANQGGFNIVEIDLPTQD